MKILSLLVTLLGLFLLTGCETTGTVTYVEPYPMIWIEPYPYYHHYYYRPPPPIHHRPPVFIHPRPVPPPMVRPPVVPRPIPPAARPSPGRPMGPRR